MQGQQTELSSIQEALVSFIIIAKDCEKDHLQECLNNILQLSLSPKEREIILVDDGSSTTPLNDLMEWQDDFIYIRQRRQGMSAARNCGLKMATGKFIQFIDGNDHIVRAPYEHCLDIARYHGPDIVCFEETNKPEAEVPFTYGPPVSGAVYLRNKNLRASVYSYLFRYHLLINLRFTPSIQREDEEFTPQLFLRADHVIDTSSKAYFRRSGKDCKTMANDKRGKIQQLADMEHIIFHLQDVASTLPSNDQAALNRRIAQLTMDYLYDTIVTTRSNRRLEYCIKRMYNRGLFPLPEKNYTKKYYLFRKLVNTKIGRTILLYSLPKQKR